MIGIATLLGAVVLWQRQDMTFALVFMWALGAIAQRHADQSALWIPALLGVGVLGLGSLWSLSQRRRRE